MNILKTYLKKTLISSLVLVWIFSPVFASAATDLEVSGWIPYWQVKEGTRDARDHLDVLTEINPFSHTVKADGTLNDEANLRNSNWKRLFKSAEREDVRIIPTVMWSNATAMHAILSTPNARERHIEEIVEMVEKGKYDGVDIDYEGRMAETKDPFSLFIKELKAELGSKILSCTIEARTPPASLYTVIPNPLKYSNDYAVIGRYCDEVKIMAYDQQRADIKLNNERKGAPYIPVADVDWVRKVVELAVQSIPKEKISLGVPTYGRIWEISVIPEQYRGYNQVKATNHVPAVELADDLDIKPARNSAGELSYTYIPETTTDPISNIMRTLAGLLVQTGVPEGDAMSASALMISNTANLPTRFNIVWWSDVEAVRQKVELAEEFDLAGIALFKIDGEEDQEIWDLFE